MGINYNSKIVTSGLVLALDAANLKSFRGVPATNLLAYPYAGWSGSAFDLSYNYPNLGATYTYVVGVANPINAPGVMRYFTGTSGYKYWAIQGTAEVSGTHTFSYYARLVGGPNQADALGNAQLWRDTGTDLSVSGDFNPTITTEWKRYATTGYVTTYLDYFPIHSGTITGGFTVEYCGFMLEAGSVATHFGVGSRGNTVASGGGWKDQSTKTNNGELYPSISYNISNGGSLVFLGSGSTTSIVIPTSTDFDTQAFTMECWCNPTTTTQQGFLFEKGQVNTQYSMFFDQNENFYFRTMGLSNQDVNFNMSNITSNNWNYIVCSYASGVKTCYVNGIQVAQTTGITGSLPTGGTNQYIGKYGDAGNNWNFSGRIAIVRVYNRALTAAEVLQNFNTHRSRFGV